MSVEKRLWWQEKEDDDYLAPARVRLLRHVTGSLRGETPLRFRRMAN